MVDPALFSAAPNHLLDAAGTHRTTLAEPECRRSSALGELALVGSDQGPDGLRADWRWAFASSLAEDSISPTSRSMSLLVGLSGSYLRPVIFLRGGRLCR